MRYLLVTPELSVRPDGQVSPGGIASAVRCTARALAGERAIRHLTVWSQLDAPESAPLIARMIEVHAHPALKVTVRCFGGSRLGLARAILASNVRRAFDQIMYAHLNQAVLGLIPAHPRYTAWIYGVEVFEPLPKLRYRALRRARTLYSCSHNTARVARETNPGLMPAHVVHLCVEPPLFALPADHDPILDIPYRPAERRRAALIVGSMYRDFLYKGHLELLDGWPQVVAALPDAELWIVGGGDAEADLKARAEALPPHVSRQIHFLGRLDAEALDARHRTCRAFAMPSRGEGFGIVFTEAMRYGVPCIAGKYDSAREIVLGNETGLLTEQTPADVANACIRLLGDDALAARLGAAGRQRYRDTFRYDQFRARMSAALASNLDGTPT